MPRNLKEILSELPAERQERIALMAELLKQFDPKQHRHELQTDVEPIGTETPPDAA